MRCSLVSVAAVFRETTILDKNERKMHVVCLILFRISPSKARFTQDIPPSPQKNNVEVRPEHFCYLLNILNNTVSESLAKVLSLSPRPLKREAYTAVATRWVCSPWSRVQLLGNACKYPTGLRRARGILSVISINYFFLSLF